MKLAWRSETECWRLRALDKIDGRTVAFLELLSELKKIMVTFCCSSSLPSLESFSENFSKFLSLSFWTVSIILSHFRAFSVFVFSVSASSENLSASSAILALRSSIVSFCSSMVSFRSLSSSAWSSMMFWRLSIGSSPFFQKGPGLVSISPK